MERGPDQLDPAARPRRQLHLGRAERQRHVEQRADARAPRRLAAVRGHGLGQRRLVGRHRRRRPTTSTSLAGTAEPGRTSPATRLCSSGNCDPTPGGTGSYFNVSAFSRLSGRGDIGNAPVTFFRLPKIVLSNMSIFKNFQMGGGKRIQFRWEAYNVFNQVNWSTLNTNAQFNPAGRAGQCKLWPGHGLSKRARHAGGDPVLVLSHR